MLATSVQPALSIALPDERALARSARSPFAGLPNLSFSHYDVEGTDAASINSAMRAHGPRDPGGGFAAGRTSYRIAFDWAETRRGSSCSVTRVTVNFSANVLLPRLTDEGELSREMREQWDKFMAVLRVHEAGHAHIAFDHVGDVRAAVAASPCGKERARGQAALERIDRLQADYDRRTHGGAEQGEILR
jgi:predicted secreted Zn-dependent protease